MHTTNGKVAAAPPANSERNKLAFAHDLPAFCFHLQVHISEELGNRPSSWPRKDE
jgi:hypothetical protein